MSGLDGWIRGVLALTRLPAFRNVLLVRGLLMAFVLRFMMAWMEVPTLAPPVHTVLVGVAAWAVLLDAGRRREDLFLGNLGIGRGAILAWALLGAGVGDLVVSTLVRGAGS